MYQSPLSRPHKRTVLRVGADHPHLYARSDVPGDWPTIWMPVRTSASPSPSCDPSVQSTEDQCPEAWNSLHSAGVSPALWSLLSKPGFAASLAPWSACSSTLRIFAGPQITSRVLHIAVAGAGRTVGECHPGRTAVDTHRVVVRLPCLANSSRRRQRAGVRSNPRRAKENWTISRIHSSVGQ